MSFTNNYEKNYDTKFNWESEIHLEIPSKIQGPIDLSNQHKDMSLK